MSPHLHLPSDATLWATSQSSKESLVGGVAPEEVGPQAEVGKPLLRGINDGDWGAAPALERRRPRAKGGGFVPSRLKQLADGRPHSRAALPDELATISRRGPQWRRAQPRKFVIDTCRSFLWACCVTSKHDRRPMEPCAGGFFPTVAVPFPAIAILCCNKRLIAGPGKAIRASRNGTLTTLLLNRVRGSFAVSCAGGGAAGLADVETW
ncbi:hypothetical protein B0H67DRAFT_92656 [Lasiosphaeris hirsuta]|uniref:Uncharacterized protein n=1 Tax=Lasiosphaeris hirsuta TaxID=260670 RepID=A0AA40BD68_9PEZI|nr:hypothetical protein B0H67DRAFT_92656 [Lasiosphaeris hirsuta]